VIRVLRLRTEPGHVSAQVFADAFGSGLWPAVLVEEVPAATWLNDTLRGAPLIGSETVAAGHFAAASAGYDFICPDYRTTTLMPWLLHLRNLSGSRLRLLLIAHAPGALGLEWALFTPLLRAGDRIVAPTASARDVIGMLSPPLLEHTCVLPHPLAALPAVTAPPAQDVHRLVSLSRIHSSKLLHRQIEAVGLLRDRGIGNVRLEIAGPLESSDSGRPLQYGRALAQQIERLGLQSQVTLVGAVRGADAKAAFLNGATALLNLSVSVEESLGKAVVEALGCGVPVVITDWDGLPETAGSAGIAVPVHADGLGVNVSASKLADALESALVSAPSPKICLAAAARFEPAVVRKAYRQQLERALAGQSEGPRLADGGLLAATAPLTVLTSQQLLDLHQQDWPRQLALLEGGEAGLPSSAERLRGLVLAGTWRPLERLLAGLNPAEHADPVGSPGQVCSALDLNAVIMAAGLCRGTVGSRLACAAELADAGRGDDLERVLDALRRDGLPPERGRYLDVELLRIRGADAELALRTALAGPQPTRDGEAHRLVQLATVARDAGLAADALPALRGWLAEFPDALASGEVWVQRAACAIACEPPNWEEAAESARRARLLVDRDDQEPRLPDWVLAGIEAQCGSVSAVRVLSPPGRTLLVQTRAGSVAVQRLSSAQRPGVVSDVLNQLAGRSPPTCPPVIATVGGGADDSGGWLVADYVDGADGRLDWPAMLEILRFLRAIPSSRLARLETAWLRRLAVVSDDPAAAALLAALATDIPADAPTLAHGDLQPSNVLIRLGSPLLVDWEEIGSAAPGFDAGWLLALARTGAISWDRDGIWTDLVAAGFREQNLRWFEALGVLRLLFRARTIRLDPQLRDLIVAQVRRAADEIRNSDRRLQHQP
jgi:glycosyltransferase involved in cell wall biosynthesis